MDAFHVMRFPSTPLRSMVSLWNLAKGLVKEPEMQLVHFSNSNFKIFPADEKVEEETHEAIPKNRYYPVHIGEVIQNKYQVLGKLGYGFGSTVWLANDFRSVSSKPPVRGV